MSLPDGERLASMETEVKNVTEKINSMENSIQNLHGKFDAFTKILTEKYVAVATFEEYKKTIQAEKSKDNIQKVLYVIVTAFITGLIAFFLREVQA